MTTHAEVAKRCEEIYPCIFKMLAAQRVEIPRLPGPPIRSSFTVNSIIYAWVVGRIIWLCCILGQVGRRIIWLANTTTVEMADTRTAMTANWNSDLVPLDRESCDFLLKS